MMTTRRNLFALFLAATITSVAHAAPAAVTCESSWPENVGRPHILEVQSRELHDGRLQYTGRYKMNTPDSNKTDCSIREIYIRLNGKIANPTPFNAPGGPAILFQVQHGSLAHNQTVKLDVVPTAETASVLYRIDANFGEQRPGNYYGRFVIVARPVK